MGPLKKISFLSEYCIFRILAFLLRLIPLKMSYKIANGFGILVARVFRIRRRVMLENLRLAFGNEKSTAELERIAEASMANLFKLACEFVRTVPAGKSPERFIEIPEMGEFLGWMKKEKGAIAIVSHFANWEWLSIPIKPFGFFTNAVGRPLKNPFAYKYIRRLREAANLKNIEKSGAVRDSIAALRRREIVAVLIDQHERRGAVWVDFFGRKASTSTLPAVLALKYGVPVFPAFFYRNENGRSFVKYGPEFPLIKTGDLRADVLANTQQYVRKIEEEIRKRPGDWLWAHRRWRVPPADVVAK
ncbi:MAG TPA: lysophospholipid acyltransferase family protein [Candidatus Omnitrophota bacterium]|nr:lysophospholipid acyltransferase family protein [Candidatus Omnitrophota bacterium]HPS36235.1 lysophospholipid acyltransferase family protein [Candidatus Omnitrophota bacterium]